MHEVNFSRADLKPTEDDALNIPFSECDLFFPVPNPVLEWLIDWLLHTPFPTSHSSDFSHPAIVALTSWTRIRDCLTRIFNHEDVLYFSLEFRALLLECRRGWSVDIKRMPVVHGHVMFSASQQQYLRGVEVWEEHENAGC